MLLVTFGILAYLATVGGVFAILDSTRETNRKLTELHQDFRDLINEIKARNDHYM